MYDYAARVVRVVDGDTLHLDVDLGFDILRRDTFRLAGINAPELRTVEGQLAKEWLELWLRDARELRITTVKDRKERYGRYLAWLWADGVNVNEAMMQAGHAVPYKA
jgi:micrococcal nuclease